MSVGAAAKFNRVWYIALFRETRERADVDTVFCDHRGTKKSEKEAANR